MRSEAYRSSLLAIAVFANENDEKLLRHVHGLASDPENKNVKANSSSANSGKIFIFVFLVLNLSWFERVIFLHSFRQKTLARHLGQKQALELTYLEKVSDFVFCPLQI
ncbi:hypothetical protein P5673_013006 [Acropora cervicornis]|uniref:Uncharacterized protein n=1 Tax=Acropora cervicornis TaxID=6130 RepID=A0AAD9V6Q5_ACRCE|nr:hypothetical protein P5673_013006 [Acropora cervicornis]